MPSALRRLPRKAVWICGRSEPDLNPTHDSDSSYRPRAYHALRCQFGFDVSRGGEACRENSKLKRDTRVSARPRAAYL